MVAVVCKLRRLDWVFETSYTEIEMNLVRMTRVADVVLAIIALIVLTQVQLSPIVRIRRVMGRPVSFPQVRSGRQGKPFVMLKSCTMREIADAAGTPLPDAERLTPSGRKPRATGFDELPHLLDVLKGEKGVVGRRPMLAITLPLRSARPSTPAATTNIGWDHKFTPQDGYLDDHSIGVAWRSIGAAIKQARRRDGFRPEVRRGSPSISARGSCL